MSKKIVSTTHKSDANHVHQTTGTPEQGLRILARIIARKLVCGMGLQEENGQVTVGETKVSGREENHLIGQRRHHRSCESDSSNDGSTEKLPDKKK